MFRSGFITWRKLQELRFPLTSGEFSCEKRFFHLFTQSIAMSLICLSYSHQHVPIAFRERVYFDSDALANACARFRCGDDQPSEILEFTVLSTCNRTQIYAFSSNEEQMAPGAEIRDEILSFISQARGIDANSLDEMGRWHFGRSVVEHLSRVACGLESLVLGEPQILGQVGDAMRMGLVMNSTGPVLAKLFQTGIRAGRRARTETTISRHSLNISTVAVNTAERLLQSLVGKTVVVLGAGEMADLALVQLRKKGVSDVKVVNRTIRKANELSEKHDGNAYVLEQINDVLPTADVLITSTGAPHTLITKEMISCAMQQRPGQKMMILDIAVPRDVELAVEDIPNVERCDIDDLHISTGFSTQLRQRQIPQVEAIIQSEVDQFLQWCRGIGVETTVASLRRKADEIRMLELGRLAKLLPDCDIESWDVIEKFANSLVNKLLHDPTVQLRQLHGTRGAVDHGEAIRQLFRLELQRERELSEANR
jgi:glutamyl-tRNA reductase